MRTTSRYARLALCGLCLLPAALAQQPAPQAPVVELRAHALALQPPSEQGDFWPTDLVDLTQLDPHIRLDIRYATANNFVGVPVYSSARAFLQRPAAEALQRVQKKLAAQGYGLVIYDGYRPWYVTRIFWDAVPEKLHAFVADPAHGSRHNRGCAVDLSLYELSTGKPLPMPSGYDEMTERAYPHYSGGSPEERNHRELLRQAMEAEGFTVYEFEWWHFDYKDWHHYAIGNLPFEQLR